MRVSRFVLLGALMVGVAAPAVAQLRAARPPRPVQRLPRLFVATPFVFATTDSTAAVRVGDGLRKRMDKVAGKWFRVISRDQMNEALMQYAYPSDAVLAPMVSLQLAKTLQARAMVAGTMSKGGDNLFSAVVRVLGVNDKAGYLVALNQVENESLEDFGKKLADLLDEAFKALPDAQECWEKQADDPEEAMKKAANALKRLPNHGLAEFCLGQIHADQHSPSDSVISHFRNATRGDSLSLDAWSQLAIQYEATGDSNGTIDTFKQMLRVAPTNQALRDNAFRVFQAYGRPDEALNVTDEAIRLDPSNPEWYDLKSNACLAQSNFACAIDALEQMYDIDAEKADTIFFLKIGIAADQQPDTTRLLKWSSLGARKYPGNVGILNYLVKAYSYAGPLDSLVATTRRYVAVDSSDVTPVLVAMQSLINEGRFDDAYSLGEIVQRIGTPDDTRNFAVMLLQRVPPLVQEQPQDYALAASVTAQILKLTTDQQVLQQANFWHGAASWNMVIALDAQIREQKTCDLVRQSEALIDEARTAMEIGQVVSQEYGQSVLNGIQGYRSTITAMGKAFCK